MSRRHAAWTMEGVMSAAGAAGPGPAAHTISRRSAEGDATRPRRRRPLLLRLHDHDEDDAVQQRADAVRDPGRGRRRRHRRRRRPGPGRDAAEHGELHGAEQRPAHAAGTVGGTGRTGRTGLPAVQAGQVPAHGHRVPGRGGARRRPLWLLSRRRVRPGRRRALLQRQHGVGPGGPGAGCVRRQHGLPAEARPQRRGRARVAVRVSRRRPGVRLGQRDVRLGVPDDGLVGPRPRQGRAPRQGVAQAPRAVPSRTVGGDSAFVRDVHPGLPRVPRVRGEGVPAAVCLLGEDRQGRHRHPTAKRQRRAGGDGARRSRALHGHHLAADHGPGRRRRRHLHMRGQQRRGRGQGGRLRVRALNLLRHLHGGVLARAAASVSVL